VLRDSFLVVLRVSTIIMGLREIGGFLSYRFSLSS
jgi:hypothetical protein